MMTITILYAFLRLVFMKKDQETIVYIKLCYIFSKLIQNQLNDALLFIEQIKKPNELIF